MTQTNTACDGNPWPELRAELRRFVRSRVADAETAEDLVQDVFVKLATQLRDGSPPQAMHAWVFTVARNAIVDHHRRAAAHAAQPGDDAEPAIAPADTLANEALLASFRRFVEDLPDEQRQAIELTEYEGVSQAELARRLGLPLSTVKSRVQRGRQRLEQALHECCSFEFDRRGKMIDWQRRPGGGCRDC